MSDTVLVPFLDLKAVHGELGTQIEEAVARVLRSGWYVLGPEVEAFEAEFASYVEARFCVGLSNGLDALVLALRAVGVGAGDEVLVPANTFIATWLAVSQVGARPVPVEPEPGTWLIDVAQIERAITPRTKAIIPVHLYGQPADLAPILELSRRRGLRVIEDAAQAQGSRYAGRRVGAHGDVVCWSFYPGKNLGAAGDAGAVTTDDAKLADKIRLIRNYGSRVKYENEVPGVNARLDELQAAILRVKLRVLDEWNTRRASIARAYFDGLASVSGLALPRVRPGAEHVFHLFVVDHANRDALQAHLAQRGVTTLIHYPTPPHKSRAYSDFASTSFPLTERAAETHLSLPIGPHLTREQVEIVIRGCQEFNARR